MQTKKEKKKVLIAIQTYEMLLDKGVDDFSLNNLLDTISMSKGSFYHYFKNKDELFCEALKVSFANIYMKYKSNKTFETFEEKLHEHFFMYLSQEKEISQYLSLINQMYYLFSNEKNIHLYNFMQENYSLQFQELNRLIEEEINKDNLKKDALEIIKPLVATADGMLTHSFMLKEYNLQKELAEYLNFISKQYKTS